jgi:hypothetical protein
MRQIWDQYHASRDYECNSARNCGTTIKKYTAYVRLRYPPQPDNEKWVYVRMCGPCALHYGHPIEEVGT